MLVAKPVMPPIAPKCLYNGLGATITASSVKKDADALIKWIDFFRSQRNMFGDNAIAYAPEWGVPDQDDYSGAPYPLTFDDGMLVTDVAARVLASIGGAVTGRSLMPDPYTETIGEVLSKLTTIRSAWEAQYRTETRKPISKTGGVIVAGGLFLGLALVSVVAYGKWKEGR